MYRALLYIPRRKPVVVTPTIKKRAITHGTGHMIGSSDPVSLISCFSNPKAFTACTTYESPSGMRGGVSTTCIEIKTPGLLECTALDVIASPAFGAEIISFSYIGVCLWAQKKKKRKEKKKMGRKRRKENPRPDSTASTGMKGRNHTNILRPTQVKGLLNWIVIVRFKDWNVGRSLACTEI